MKAFVLCAGFESAGHVTKHASMEAEVLACLSAQAT
jgi:hypothetical protein